MVSPQLATFAQAVRLGWWALGQRQHQRAQKRAFWIRAFPRRNLAEESLAEIAPWDCETYPGRTRAFAELIGVKPSTGRKYLGGHNNLPPKHALRLAEYLDEKQKRISDIVIRLREYANREQPGISRRRLDRLALAHEEGRKAYIRKVVARQEAAEAATLGPGDCGPTGE